MPLIYINKLTEDDIFSNNEVIFLFAENEAEKGGSQLAREFRGSENCVGLRVKRGPTSHRSAYYTEDDIYEALNNIDEDLEAVVDHLSNGGVVITTPTMFDDNGLEDNSPSVFEYVKEKLVELERM